MSDIKKVWVITILSIDDRFKFDHFAAGIFDNESDARIFHSKMLDHKEIGVKFRHVQMNTPLVTLDGKLIE